MLAQVAETGAPRAEHCPVFERDCPNRLASAAAAQRLGATSAVGGKQACKLLSWFEGAELPVFLLAKRCMECCPYILERASARELVEGDRVVRECYIEIAVVGGEEQAIECAPEVSQLLVAQCWRDKVKAAPAGIEQVGDRQRELA